MELELASIGIGKRQLMARIPFLSFFLFVGGVLYDRVGKRTDRFVQKELWTQQPRTTHTHTHTCDRIMPVGGSARENTRNNQSLGGGDRRRRQP